MDDPNLILTVTAFEKSFQLSQNRTRCPAANGDGSSSRDPTPGPEQEEHPSKLMLRFGQRPKDIMKGFVFGTDPLLCDVVLESTIGEGKNRQRNKISGQHFRIAFDDQNRLILEDTSRWGIAVSYDGQGWGETAKVHDNGKMSQEVYINQILEPHVKPLLEKGEDFVLEEDGDSGHGTGKNSKVMKWKAKHGLKNNFNCASSPDLAVIENCWQPVKLWLDKSDHWDDETLLRQIKEGWERVDQRWINYLIYTMPE